MLRLAQAKNKEAAEKVRKGVIDLLFRAPLFGLTILGSAIKVEEKLDIETACTDGRTIWYSPDFVLAMEQDVVMFVLLHESLHVFNNHVARMGTRDPRLWNYACDMRIAHDGLRICRARGPWELPSNHVPAFTWAEKLSAEQIYEELLKHQEKQQKQKQKDQWSSLNVPATYEADMVKPTDEVAAPEADAEFRRQLVQDLAQAQLAEEQMLGKKGLEELYGSAVWERLVELKRCEVPWHVLLQGRLAASLGQDTASWLPPNRRWFPQLAMPSRRGSMEQELLLGVDVSGSITDDDLARFRAIIGPAIRRAKVTTVVTFDAQIRERITTTRAEKVLRELKFATGSHSYTDVREVFDIINERRPSAVAIITDGHVRYPERAYPNTHWILTPTGANPPWGRPYRLHTSW